MVRILGVLMCVLLAGFALHFADPAHSEESATVAFFYADLAPYGHWVDHPIYGTVWVPDSHEPGWYPYSRGRWVWTSDYGWYWDSDEEFGWATYHYGRWMFTSDLGWVWIPDDVWGPAWVDWRYSSDGYVGWAPMPPQYRWSAGTGLSAGVDMRSKSYASTWLFVPERDFARADIRGHLLIGDRAASKLRVSSRVTNYSVVNGRIVNRSFDPGVLSSRTKVRISPVKTRRVEKLEASASIRANGGVPLFIPPARIHADTRLDTSIGDGNRLDTDSGFSVQPEVTTPTISSPPVGVDENSSVELGAGHPSVGGGLGFGLGGGGAGMGGGLRLGR